MPRYDLLASFNEPMYHLLWFAINPYKADEPFGEGHPCWIEDYLLYSLARLMCHLPWLASFPSWEVHHLLRFSAPPCWAGVPLAMAFLAPLLG